MPKRKQLLTYEDAKPNELCRQHKKPCSDCPWARTSLPGWLADMTPEEWIEVGHRDGIIECHTVLNAQCAGAAIYRANVLKSSRNAEALRLKSDKELVFATPKEFLEHHKRK